MYSSNTMSAKGRKVKLPCWADIDKLEAHDLKKKINSLRSSLSQKQGTLDELNAKNELLKRAQVKLSGMKKGGSNRGDDCPSEASDARSDRSDRDMKERTRSPATKSPSGRRVSYDEPMEDTIKYSPASTMVPLPALQQLEQQAIDKLQPVYEEKLGIDKARLASDYETATKKRMDELELEMRNWKAEEEKKLKERADHEKKSTMVMLQTEANKMMTPFENKVAEATVKADTLGTKTQMLSAQLDLVRKHIKDVECKAVKKGDDLDNALVEYYKTVEDGQKILDKYRKMKNLSDNGIEMKGDDLSDECKEALEIFYRIATFQRGKPQAKTKPRFKGKGKYVMSVQINNAYYEGKGSSDVMAVLRLINSLYEE